MVACGSTRSQRVSELVKSEPQILYHRGKMIEEALKRTAEVDAQKITVDVDKLLPLTN